MISGTIPIYYGQKILRKIPKNTYIRINKKDSVDEIIKFLKNIIRRGKSLNIEKIFLNF